MNGARRGSTADTAAVRMFPQLGRLIDLCEAGWRFLPVSQDGELMELRGVYTWNGGWADAMMVRDVGDAAALRMDYTGGVVWQREGSLDEIADELIMLPPPGAPNAPRLVRGFAPGLWIR